MSDDDLNLKNKQLDTSQYIPPPIEKKTKSLTELGNITKNHAINEYIPFVFRNKIDSVGKVALAAFFVISAPASLLGHALAIGIMSCIAKIKNKLRVKDLHLDQNGESPTLYVKLQPNTLKIINGELKNPTIIQMRMANKDLKNAKEIESKFNAIKKGVQKTLDEFPMPAANKYVDPNIKEMHERMKPLQTAIENNPQWVIKNIMTYENDPMYKEMGSTKFLSFLAKSNENLGENLINSPLNELERVALFGYTTGDYRKLNPAIREGNLEPGMKAYINYAIAGMEKLPDVDQPSEEIMLKRAVFTEPYPGWAVQKFQEGKIFSDSAFSSATFDLSAKGFVNLTITNTKNAKDVGPYSAWQGEKEILIIPGTEYTVKEVRVVSVKEIYVILEPVA